MSNSAAVTVQTEAQTAKVAKVAGKVHGEVTEHVQATQIQPVVFETLRHLATLDGSYKVAKGYLSGVISEDRETYAQWSTGQHALNARAIVGHWLNTGGIKVNADELDQAERVGIVHGLPKVLVSLLNNNHGATVSKGDLIATIQSAKSLSEVWDAIQPARDALAKAKDSAKGESVEPVADVAPIASVRSNEELRAVMAQLAERIARQGGGDVWSVMSAQILETPLGEATSAALDATARVAV